MRHYQLLQNYRGLLANKMFYGPYLIAGGGYGYVQEADIPPTGQPVEAALFASFVEKSDLFKLVTQ